MVPVIMKISKKKEAFSSKDILLDFLWVKGVCVCGGGGGEGGSKYYTIIY